VLMLKGEELEVIVTMMAVFVAQRDSAYTWLKVSNSIAVLTPCKQKHSQQLSVITLN